MSDILTGGDWAPTRRGIAVWVERGEPAARLDTSTLIACPTCHARVNQECRSAAGNVREPHVTRLAPRLCRCGATLAYKKQMCEPCRADARRETYRLRELRRPTRTRRRAA